MRLNEREVHGGTLKAGSNTNPVILCERDTDIMIRQEYHKIAISPASARVMARNLQRLARRIEARQAASAIEARRTETLGSVEDESATEQSEGTPNV